MWKILLMRLGNCDAVDSHTEREVYVVEDLMMATTLSLCAKCLLAQTKLRSKGRRSEGAAEAPRPVTHA